MMSTKTDRYRQYAANAAARAAEGFDKAHKGLDAIPFGQPRIIRPNGNDGGHQRTVERANRNMDKAIEENKRAEYWQHRADYVEHRENKTAAIIADSDEEATIGDTVTARFTNSGRTYQFTGEIVGRNRNEWKVKTITHPEMIAGFSSYPNSYKTEALGRVFSIPAKGRPRYSQNNGVTR